MKRFYKEAEAQPHGDGWMVMLDGRAVKTPSKREVAMPTRGLAEAVAQEWAVQADEIDMDAMPLTRFSGIACDVMVDKRDDILADIGAYGLSDLLCYRGDEEALQTRQREQWDPVLAWAAEYLHLPLECTIGVMPVAQPDGTSERVQAVLGQLDQWQLTGVAILTKHTGSLVLALAGLYEAYDAPQMVAIAQLDEIYQAERWGDDAEAEAHRADKASEIEAAMQFLRLIKG